jgi:predicted DNA-binding antitoxin AbrB/MazE fold protein
MGRTPKHFPQGWNPSSYNQGVMVRQLEAVYERGLLRPLEPLSLNERQRVRLTLDDQPSPADEVHTQASSQANERREEMLWLVNEAGPYAGKWVALSGNRLIAHGTDAAKVRAAARAAGVERPLLTHLPANRELPFGGW